MNAKQKKIVKIVGISLGAVLLIGGGVALAIYLKTRQEPSDEPITNSGNLGSNNSSQSNSPYTKTEIERMQAWLMQVAITYGNEIIINAIRNTGGIDGKIGTGFNTALNEAIKKGYVKSLADLYNKTN